MKRFLLLLALCCAPMCAQSTSPITVTVKTGAVQKIWQFILGSPTSITSFTCTQPPDAHSPGAGQTLLMPGDISTCTVTIVQGAGNLAAPTQVAVTVPSPLVLSADPNAPSGVTLVGSVLSIPSGSTVGSFLVTYSASQGAALQLWPAAYWVSTDWSEPEYFAELLIPCCAQANLCGLPLAQVSQEPCQG